MRANDVIECFVIESVHSGTRLEFSGAVPRGLSGYDDCTYQVRLTGGPVDAAEEVTDIQPHRWAALFEDIAKHWRGWEGAKAHESLEGQLKIACTMDRTGHVRLRVELRGDMAGADWRAVDTLFLEAGHLDVLAIRARAYFG